MSERGKRVVRVLLDRERDADVVERIERQGSITGYLRTLVRRDIHDERLDYAAMKAAEYQDKNEQLRELVRDMWHDGMCECDERGACAECEYHFPDRMRELGVEV